MKIPRIYLDTPAIGGCFDDEFQDYSNALFQDLGKVESLELAAV